MQCDYYSENWSQATEKFCAAARRYGNVSWVTSRGSVFDIPYVQIGDGPHHVVVNSGVHGLEGYFGSAAQLMFLDKIVPNIAPEILRRYTITLIHVINGWGMQNRMREVRDPNGGLVDLNRNFGVDFSRPDSLPRNDKYCLAHDLLLSPPDAVVKKNAIKAFRSRHLNDGAWAAISFGQYTHPYGLFYGGNRPMDETQKTLRIYDAVMADGARSLISIGLHTGLGRFNRRAGVATAKIVVSHPAAHPNTKMFHRIFDGAVAVEGDENTAAGPVLLGDLVDCLEARYRPRGIPVYSADMEIGTGEFPIMSPIYKRMDMGDARYDLLHDGRINPQTWRNLTESWYPSAPSWRASALNSAYAMFAALVSHLSRESGK